MDSTVPHFKDSLERLLDSQWTRIFAGVDFLCWLCTRVTQPRWRNPNGKTVQPVVGVAAEVWGYGPDIWTTNYTQGCVMVDVINPRTNELVWRGRVTDTINGIGQSEKQSDQAAKDLVKQFLKDAKKVDKNLDKKPA